MLHPDAPTADGRPAPRRGGPPPPPPALEIADGKIKDGDVSFKVTRKGRNNNEITITYSGKISGDTFKGKSEMSGGNAQAREFEAKRAKE
jgi:hypothetical protein